MIEGKITRFITSILVIIFTVGFLGATEPENDKHQQTHQTEHKNEGHETESHKEHKEFDPAAFMFDHIGDAYDWHILDIGKKQISVPLPVILYSKEKGFNIFFSSKFHHGHSSYKGFHIAHEGETIEKVNSEGKIEYKDVKGKIVENLNDGTKALPLDISMTKNIVALFISIIFLLLIFTSVAKAYKQREGKSPKGLQSFIEPIILFIRDDIAKPSIGKKYEKFMPYLLTVFFFILINNLMGLIPIIPGGANVTGNIAVTMVLAFFTFIITTINGNKSYWKHIFNTPGVPVWLKIPPLPIMPIVETIGVFTKPFVLMVRLFANITAGHIIAMGFLSLIFLFGEMNQVLGYGVSVVSVAFIIFMSFLELLVAFIQAYVFTFLSAIYFGMAVEEHH